MFVCVSQDVGSASQTRFALEFGEQFAKLDLRERKVPVERLAEMRRCAMEVLVESRGKLEGGGIKLAEKFRVIREAMVRDCTHLLDVHSHFEPADDQLVSV